MGADHEDRKQCSLSNTQKHSQTKLLASGPNLHFRPHFLPPPHFPCFQATPPLSHRFLNTLTSLPLYLLFPCLQIPLL